MSDPTKKPHHEAKRLRKAVKRRRGYANNLRDTANEMARTGEDAEFARKLHMLADSELAMAREEAELASNLDNEARVQSTTHFSSVGAMQRAQNAMAAMKGRFAIDRLRTLAEGLGVVSPESGSMRQSMEAVEAALGFDDEGAVPLMGERITRAEQKFAG